MRSFVLAATTLAFALPAMAQQTANSPSRDTVPDSLPPAATTAETPKTVFNFTPEIVLQHVRPQDQRGINMFETPKYDEVPYTGFRLSWGAAFTQQFQSMSHETTAVSRLVAGVEQNRLMKIGTGFNNATANLTLGAQLAPGIRVALTSYLSSRHHNETWVKDGYLLIDESPFKLQILKDVMQLLTLKVGHFEVNYGDAHFRRSDNGNAIYNPFVGNLIMDAFTTEIGGEMLVRVGPVLAMGGITGGESRGNVTRPDDRAYAFLGKLGYDRQFTDDLRIRLTGSTFQQAKSISNTLYAGDRAGSRYYWVMENDAPTTTESSAFRSGLINPGFGSKIKAYMINPFVKYQGLELFGTLEQAKGRTAAETVTRTWKQYAGEAVYRFAADDQLYVGGRYNKATGELAGMANDVSTDRIQLGAGWFITPGLLMKGEWVTQKFTDFPATDIRNGGKFKGFMVEGVVAF
jgi:hypothetical protein